jgi:cysteine desulfurase/selenocysteine lyase
MNVADIADGYIRRDFKILEAGPIYLDSAATSLTPNQVVEAMNEYYFVYNANVERGVHRLSQRASEEYEQAHRKVAGFFGANEKEVIFTKNTTESLNLVASGLAWHPGDKVVLSLLEHHSNFITWLRARDREGLELEIVRPTREGLFDLADFARAIDRHTRLVSVTHVSNVLGSVSPVAEIASLAHAAGALMMIDAAQSAPHLALDVKALDCDFMACSGHKMMGPTGIGVLYVRAEVMDQVEPLTIGGGAIRDVSIDGYELAEPWERYEAGTPNIAAGIGLGAAVGYLQKIGMKNIQQHEALLTQRLVEGLHTLADVQVYGPRQAGQRSSIVSFNVKGHSPHRVAAMLDEMASVMVRSGHHCCYPLIKYLLEEPQGTVRASLYIYNTPEEIEIMVATLKDILTIFG